jgi:hypothetical protein
LQYFTFTSCSPTASTIGSPSWEGTLTRNSNSSYSYTVKWNETGYDSSSTISGYPAISPVTYTASAS